MGSVKIWACLSRLFFKWALYGLLVGRWALSTWMPMHEHGLLVGSAGAVASRRVWMKQRAELLSQSDAESDQGR
jgi:hypothetical protein